MARKTTPSPISVPAWLGSPLLWFGVALVIRLMYLSHSAGSVLFGVQLLDEQEALVAARGLLSGAGFGAEPLFKAPLYPVLVAGTMFVAGDLWIWLLRLLQHVLGAVLAALAADTARRVAGPRNGIVAAALAGAFIALHGPLVRLENRLVLDFLSVFWQSAMVWALLRGMAGARRMRWMVGAGALGALAWLTRPTITPVLPFLALWLLGVNGRNLLSATRRRFVRAAVFLAFAVAAMAVVGARNAVVGGEFMILPWQGGYNFFEANKPGASGRYLRQGRVTMDESGNPARRLTLEGFDAAVARGEVPEPKEGERFGAVDAWWFGRAKRAIAQDPAAWLGLMTRKALYLVSDREVYNFEDYTVQRERSLLLRLLPGRFGFLWPLAFASLAFVRLENKGRRRATALLWLYAVLLAGAIALYYTSGRLRMPLVFPAAILAALGAARFAAAVGDRMLPRKRLVAFVVLLVVGGAMSWGDWWGVRSENVRHAEFLRLSNAAFHARRYDEALAFALEAEREKPGLVQAIQLRAQAAYGLGDFDAAEAGFREATVALPEDPVAPANLGILLLHDRDDAASAVPFFEESLKRNARHRPAAWHGAIALMRLGRVDQAAEWIAPDLPVRAGAPVPLMQAAAAVACARGDKEEARRLATLFETAYGTAPANAVRAELTRLGMTDCLE
ncbi:MAG: hypothetical protein PWP23_233 [Candidatus Sumerlaeota bacterium]|nr:hypothetical protein [Candidatus Sumerlaeota bacterium]